MLNQFLVKGRDELPILIVDRALTAEVVIVLGHFEHALARYVLASQDISRNGMTSPGDSGPPNDATRIASYFIAVSKRPFDFFRSPEAQRIAFKHVRGHVYTDKSFNVSGRVTSDFS